MKEDVLEQIVDDYLQFDGFFTTHNVRSVPGPITRNTLQRRTPSHQTSTLLGTTRTSQAQSASWS
jgi:hypothetical protein